MPDGRGDSAQRTGFTPLNVVGSPPAGVTAPPPSAEPASVDADIAALGERVGALIEELTEHPDPEVGKKLDELLDGIDHLHREALTRLAGLLEHHDLLGHAVEDPVIGATLDIYELRPEAVAANPEAAPAPALPVSYPRVTMPPPAPTPGLIPLNAPARPAPAPPPPSALAFGEGADLGRTTPSIRTTAVPMVPIEAAVSDEPAEWLDLCHVDEIAPGMVFAPDEGALLLTHAGGKIHAFRNGCGNGPLALHMGRVVDGTKLVCPWHIACVYDMATGISGEPPDQRRLIRYPIRVAGGTVQVAFNKAYSPPQPEPAPSATG